MIKLACERDSFSQINNLQMRRSPEEVLAAQKCDTRYKPGVFGT